jgi:SAM-dependent methyltransferase/uncharacterized protein YbaR (Trm112 family)
MIRLPMETQDLRNKAGEISFRARLFEQQVHGTKMIAGELSSDEMLAVVRQRMEVTRRDFTELAQAGLLQGPFLELGAERCQRSLVAANDFRLEGYAADLSFESLSYASFLAEQENISRIPQRLCCDAYKLPLADNSISFAFCYQTLHHFPDPTPIFQELYRVLKPGAALYVNEEPIRRLWKVNLWKRRVAPRAKENKYLRFAKDYLLDFVSDPHVNEVDYGICENDEISLQQWDSAMGNASQKRVRLRVLPLAKPLSRVEHDASRWGVRSWLCNGLGGVLTAIIIPKPAAPTAIHTGEPVCCPACGGAFSHKSSALLCSACRTEYPVRDNIFMLLPPDELRKLYPTVVPPTNEAVR